MTSFLAVYILAILPEVFIRVAKILLTSLIFLLSLLQVFSKFFQLLGDFEQAVHANTFTFVYSKSCQKLIKRVFVLRCIAVVQTKIGV